MKDFLSSNDRLACLIRAQVHLFEFSSKLLYCYMYFVICSLQLWFNFLLFQTHYHTLPYPKTKEKKFKPRTKLTPNIYYCD